jgi:uncharacterized protein (DUF736 family)
MLNLGTFERDGKTERIVGIIFCVGLPPTQLVFEPAINGKGKNYYKIYANALSKIASAEAGTAWPNVAVTGKATHYFTVRLNSPVFAAPLYGKLYPSDAISGQYHLLWEEQDCPTKVRAEIRKPER